LYRRKKRLGGKGKWVIDSTEEGKRREKVQKRNLTRGREKKNENLSLRRKSEEKGGKEGDRLSKRKGKKEKKPLGRQMGETLDAIRRSAWRRQGNIREKGREGHKKPSRSLRGLRSRGEGRGQKKNNGLLFPSLSPP